MIWKQRLPASRKNEITSSSLSTDYRLGITTDGYCSSLCDAFSFSA
jgi:hypothetical protein